MDLNCSPNQQPQKKTCQAEQKGIEIRRNEGKLLDCGTRLTIYLAAHMHSSSSSRQMVLMGFEDHRGVSSASE